ncbi:hypothetical protein AB1A65_04060 [Muricauda sp. ANG21]|uniref:hypothetical protein n=1 Tax=Allomuricauda sp. ANG21 TaxID=3042468 RepID=UPI00345358DA
MKSKFKADLSKEQHLAPLLNLYYQKHLKRYSFQRIVDLEQQLLGIDLILTNKKDGATYFVDEKAQLDYINERLPTFAFELFYGKNNKRRQGWLLDTTKKTHFYALVTSIFSDEKNLFTFCNITFVNREKLIQHLTGLGLHQERFQEIAIKHKGHHGKLGLEKLHPWHEGYLFFSTQNKAEQPINLILKLDYLIAIGVAKRLV